MPRGKLPSGFGKTLKALYAQGYTSKDAMREAWKIHRGSGPGMHRKQQSQKYLNPISHKKALRYAKELVKHEKAGVKENPKNFTMAGVSFRRRGIYAFERGTHRPIRKREWEKIRGLRQNPIVVYNPARSSSGRRARANPHSIVTGASILPMHNVEIRYQRSAGEYRSEWFKHPFESSVEILGLQDGSILIRSKSGKKLWGAV